MKKKIIIGVLFAAFLLVMLPSVPAVEYKTVEDEQTRYYQGILEKIRENPDEYGPLGPIIDRIIDIILDILQWAITTLIKLVLGGLLKEIAERIITWIISLIFPDYQTA